MASEFFEARLLFIRGRRAYYSSLAMKAIVVEEFGGPEVLRLVDARPGRHRETDSRSNSRRGGQPCGHLHPRRHLCSQTAAALYPGSDGSGVVAPSVKRWKALQLDNASFFPDQRRGPMPNLPSALPEQVHALPETATFSQGAALCLTRRRLELV